MSDNATNFLLLAALLIGGAIAVISVLRYRYYKLSRNRFLLPEKVTAHVIDQPGGEHVRILGRDNTVYDWEHDE